MTLPNAVLNTISTGPFTVEAWVRGLEAEQPAHPRILSNRNMVNNGFMFGFHGVWGGSAHKMLAMQLDGMNYILINNGSYNGNILDGTCHHVAVTKGADSLRFHVDGVHIGSKVQNGTPSTTTTAADMLIGNDGPDPFPFKGHLSQVRLWDHARTTTEIAADMHMSIPGTAPGLLGYWELNEGRGGTVLDKTTTTDGLLGSTPSAEGSDPLWVDDCCDLDLTTGIDGTPDRAGIRIFPNPAQHVVQLELPPSLYRSQLSIIDITGRSVMQRTINGQLNVVLDVAGLPSGMYLIQLRAGDTGQMVRFVKE